MNTWTLWTVMCLCSIGAFASSVEINGNENNIEKNSHITDEQQQQGESHVRDKRTLFLKKKIIGAGILGLGLGLAKGYKVGHYHGPEVHHVYLSPPPPPVRYVEYVEKPVYIEKAPIEYDHHPWSPPEPPSHSYGSW